MKFRINPFTREVNIIMYNFNMFGQTLSFEMKLVKHKNDPTRLKDYILVAYDTVNPEFHDKHPCWVHIAEAMKTCRDAGWKFSVMEWKNTGKQMVAMSPTGEYYRSKYQHT